MIDSMSRLTPLLFNRSTFVLLFCILSVNLYGFQGPSGDKISLENGKILLEFDRLNGAFLRMTDLESTEVLATSASPGSDSPWEIHHQADGSDRAPIDIKQADHFSFQKPDPLTLELTWSGFGDNKEMAVTATIILEKDQPFSSWGIRVENMGEDVPHKVVFPSISGLVKGENVKLAVPEWMGSLINNPEKHLAARGPGKHHFEWLYPGSLSMQFLALYNEGGKVFYAASDDPHAYPKKFMLARSESGSMMFQLENFPAVDDTLDFYRPVYHVKIGAITGDWISAAEHYKEWAVEQSWSLNSRFKNGQTPSWLEETALWVWNRGRSEGVLSPAVALKERLGLPISVLWHWWHGTSYDDGFPEYFPPREGIESFATNVKAAREKGVRPLVYMNELQWGSSTESWKTKNAHLYAVKDENGGLRSHVYNIFSGKALTNMCITTPFWRNTYASLALKAINEFGVGGIYMDQACISRMCYDKSHGHSLGGGNYWARYSGMLTDEIRSGVPVGEEITLSGEGACEAWLPYLDAFLALQVSRERYSAARDWETIPLFQAVYHEYGITYGNYSSLLSPPYDELWPEEHRPTDMLTLLDASYNQQFLMEQARSFVWGMQPMISNYQTFLDVDRKEEMDYLMTLARIRNKNLKYLLHGAFLRAPDITIPRENMTLSRLSIYAGRKDKVTTSEKELPTVYHSAWKSPDGMVGIALASIRDTAYPLSVEFMAKEYDLSGSGKIYLNDKDGRKELGTYKNGMVKIKYNLQPKEICLIEIVPQNTVTD